MFTIFVIKGKETLTMYAYGMRLGGFSVGCQPMDGFVERIDDDRGKYHDILMYDRMLTDREVSDYELDYIGQFEKICTVEAKSF